MLYFAIIISLSAFLLFQIQPMIGKYILPWFGGTPAVWSTTMLFFQTLLTAGYGYAYWLIGKLSAKQQGIVHLLLLSSVAGLLILTRLGWTSPIMPDAAWKPHDVAYPVLDIFKILGIAVGLPYLILATNSPLMQAWFSRAYPGRSPYRLYALSNIGSLLALVSYPVLIEPNVSLSAQGSLWSIGFIVFITLVALGAWRTIRKPDASSQALADEQAAVGDARPSAFRQIMWIALAACASILLLATTSQITQEIAVIPFLWVLPLTIYLLTFILCFDSDRWYARTPFTLAFCSMLGLYILVLARGPNLGITIQIAIYAVLLFLSCMICHGELVRLKPHPRYLTSFYLMVSVGGAIGGIATTLIAPILFKGYWELPIGLLACAVLLLLVTLFNRTAITTQRATYNLAIVISGAIILLGGITFFYIKATTADSLVAMRNFYGILRVTEINPNNTELHAYQLAHGATVHGMQFIATDKRNLPTTYFTEKSGIGLALLNHPKRPGAIRIGVLGEGIGTLASYAQLGDSLRFYEINPDVIRLAEGEGGYFTYLANSRAEIHTIAGDARISLEQELANGQNQNFDVLVLDTFNSDSIPTHLITREAFQVYLAHLAPEGILAVHISNHHIDLRPVVYNLAEHFGLYTALIEAHEGEYSFLSTWVLVTRDAAFFDQPAIAKRAIPRHEGDTIGYRLWTDDYSNLFQILR